VWIASDNTVVTEWVSTFKHAGTLLGLPATDKLAGVTGLSVVTFTPEGLVKTEHRYFDTVTIAGQVGIAKTKVRPMVVNVPSNWETFVAKDADEKNVDKLKALYAAVEKKSEPTSSPSSTSATPCATTSRARGVARIELAKQEFAEAGKSFPDMKIKIDGVWGVGDFVIAEITLGARTSRRTSRSSSRPWTSRRSRRQVEAQWSWRTPPTCCSSSA